MMVMKRRQNCEVGKCEDYLSVVHGDGGGGGGEEGGNCFILWTPKLKSEIVI